MAGKPCFVYVQVQAMASLAQDPYVLRVADLLEARQRLDKEHAELSKEIIRHREERDATRKAFQDELMAAQEAEEAGSTRRNEAQAEVAAVVQAIALERGAELHPAGLRQQLLEERERYERLLAEQAHEAESLHREREQSEEMLRQATQASRAEVARRAPLDVPVSDVLAELRATVEQLAATSAELQSVKVATEREVASLRSKNDEAQGAAAEADAIRREREAEVQRKVHEVTTETRKLSTQLANAREHTQELRSQLRTQLQSAYDGRLASREIKEQAVQSRYAAEDSQLKDKVRLLSEELEDLKQRRLEHVPWWAQCLRHSAAGSIGNTAVAGAGAALMRAAGHAPSTPRALTPRGHNRATTPRSGRRPSTGSASGRRPSAGDAAVRSRSAERLHG